MAAVSNSSPLIFYAAIGRLDLLRSLFDEVLIPPAVWREVVAHGSGRAGASDVESARWILWHPSAVHIAPEFVTRLHPGEAEAIALANSFQPKLPILLDDYRARQAARNIGLEVIGSGGVLALAKVAELIPRVGPLLAALQGAGLYLSDGAISEILEVAEET